MTELPGVLSNSLTPAAPEYSRFKRVLQRGLGEDHTFATKHLAVDVVKAFDGFAASAILDDSFLPILITQADQFTVKFLVHPPIRSGDTSSMPMISQRTQSCKSISIVEFHQLALVLLVLVYCNSNGDTNEPGVSPASEMSPRTHSEAEVTFVDEGYVST
jgi:hypothetical protein